MAQLGDIVQWKDPSEIKSHLENQAQMLSDLEASIKKIKRDDLTVSLSNIIRAAAFEMKRLASAYPDSVDTLAWSTRNLFEINLITRKLLDSDSDLVRWLGQRASDEIDVIKGILELADNPSSDQRVKLQRRLSEIENMCKRCEIVPSRSFNIMELAKHFSLEKEYRSLYKLFSKYVHPSSWRINGDQEALASMTALNIFIVSAQLYSGDLYSRVCTKLGIVA